MVTVKAPPQRDVRGLHYCTGGGLRLSEGNLHFTSADTEIKQGATEESPILLCESLRLRGELLLRYIQSKLL